MKKILIVGVLATVLFAGGACKKPNEVPASRTNYERDYVLPSPPVMTAEENEIIQQRKREYESIK